ncbi:MAG: hypothetical protein HYU97_11370 [Deltaproteobacteria bacterium]|nr:hypothetical protein [Deltaproteobacteria bacterium]
MKVSERVVGCHPREGGDPEILKKDYRGEITACTQGVQRFPKGSWVCSDYVAESYVDLGEIDKALIALWQGVYNAVGIEPVSDDDRDARRFLHQKGTKIAYGEYQKARESLEKSPESDPNKLRLAIACSQFFGYPMNIGEAVFRAFALYTDGDIGAGVGSRLDPFVRWQKAEDIKQSHEFLTEYVKAHPDDQKSLLALIFLELTKSRKPDNKIAEYAKALAKLDPNNAVARKLLLVSRVLSGEFFGTEEIEDKESRSGKAVKIVWKNKTSFNEAFDATLKLLPEWDSDRFDFIDFRDKILKVD